MSEDKVDLARRATHAFNRRHFDGAFAELGTPDFEWFPAIVRGLDGGGGYRGREGVEKYVADIRENREELRALPGEFRDLGDRVLVIGRLEARGKGIGAPVDTPYAGIFDFRGDRIWRYRVHLDRAEAMQAAGLSE
jgi:ketosteroid isomerase-like protein